MKWAPKFWNDNEDTSELTIGWLVEWESAGWWQDESRKPFPDSKVRGANMGPTWVLSAPDGPHVGPMNLAIRVGKGSDMLHKENAVMILTSAKMAVKSHLLSVLIKTWWMKSNKSKGLTLLKGTINKPHNLRWFAGWVEVRKARLPLEVWLYICIFDDSDSNHGYIITKHDLLMSVSQRIQMSFHI